MESFNIANKPKWDAAGVQLFHLHAHQTFSMLDGYGTPEQVAARVKKIGQAGSAITDHGNCFGHVPWQRAAKKAGIKSVLGCEFYLAEDMRQQQKYFKNLGVEGFPHITILANCQEGYENFLQLVEDATREGFYYKPRIDVKEIIRRQKGLTILTGCPTGMPSRLVAEDRYEAAESFIRELRDNCDDVVVEIVPHSGYDPSAKAQPWLIDTANRLGMPYVFTGDCHFPGPEDHKAQDLMVHISMKIPYGQPKAINMPWSQYYCEAWELAERIRMVSDEGVERFGIRAVTDEEIVRGLNMSVEIAERCNVEIMQGKSVSFPDRGETSPGDALRASMERGFTERVEQGTLIVERMDEYRSRAEREYKVINDKGFADYILAIADICRYIKSQDSPVMCRGSAGGSVLLWLVGASETDPVLHDLSFERFYDENRPDPPDVDVDFETRMKSKVIEYIYAKYGADHCAQLMALGLMRAKVAVIDTAGAMCIERKEYEALTMAIDSKDDDLDHQMDEMTDPEIVKVIQKYPQLGIASKLVGQVRQSTIHACGVIVSAEPLYKCAAIIQREGQAAVCSIDKHAAGQLGLLKFDLLSVKGYDVVANAMHKIGRPVSDLYKLKFDDPKVFDMARSGNVVGVFQLDGAAMQIGREIGLDRFDELFAASALCRPGASQFVPLYKDNKFNKDRFERYMGAMDPRAAAIVRPTYGVVLYQEQMMAFARMSGYSWVDVHKLRKRVAASSFHGYALGAEWSEPFITGCVERGISQREAEHWWAAIKEHGVYSFNKSHCVTYAIVSYWMLWLKTYHAEAYYEAFLASEGAQTSPKYGLMKRLITEFRRNGGKVQLISKDNPTTTFHSPRPGYIAGGWGNLVGVGSAGAQKVVDGGPYTTWKELSAVLPPGVYGKIVESGITGEMRVNNGKRLSVAPWFPAGETAPDIVEKMKQWRASVAHPGQLKIGEPAFGALVSGYVSTRTKKPRTGSFKGDQIVYTIEDETGVISARVSTKKKDVQVKVFGALEVGDYVVLKGWWTGDGTLFISEFVMIKKVTAT